MLTTNDDCSLSNSGITLSHAIMENSTQQLLSNQYSSALSSGSSLQLFFQESLQELYYAKNRIADAFSKIQHRISSPQVERILANHQNMHQAHKKRLEKIFDLLGIPLVEKECAEINAILAQVNKNIQLFSHDMMNWEITLILTSRKLVHYKIASYGAVAHLAIRLNHMQAATLLAISVQEEEEFTERFLNGLTDEFLSPYTK